MAFGGRDPAEEVHTIFRHERILAGKTSAEAANGGMGRRAAFAG